MDIRNELNIELARLRSQDQLKRALPISVPVFIEEKLNGARYSLQMGGNEQPLFVSRGKHGAAKGAALKKDSSFIITEIPPNILSWMNSVSMTEEMYVLDGELMGGGSVCDAMTKAGEKEYWVYDIIMYLGATVREQPMANRKAMLRQVFMTLLSDPHCPIKLHPWVEADGLTVEMYDHLLSEARERKIEGFVIKPLDWKYDKKCGYKLKPIRDSIDGVILSCTSGKKHHLGAVTKSENIGSVRVGQYNEEGELIPTAWVPVGGWEVPIEQKDALIGRVVEFTSSGWDASQKRWSFPANARLRAPEEKSVLECVFEL